jgi:hypothetical protein
MKAPVLPGVWLMNGMASWGLPPPSEEAKKSWCRRSRANMVHSRPTVLHGSSQPPKTMRRPAKAPKLVSEFRIAVPLGLLTGSLDAVTMTGLGASFTHHTNASARNQMR